MNKLMDNAACTGVSVDMAESIAALIQTYLVQKDNDAFESEGKKYLINALQNYTDKQQKVALLLPGFPCKSPNCIDKSFSAMPDYGEVLAIQRLDNLCNEINRIYPPGSQLTIVSDGTTFSDVVQVDRDAKEGYKHALRSLTATNNISWADLSSLLPELKENRSDDDTRKALVRGIAKGARPYQRFIEKVKSDPQQVAMHDKMCSYLYHDINLERFSDDSRDQYLKTISDKAYQMMYRGKALNHGLEKAFPHHIRLSVHQYNNAGPKFTISLSGETSTALSPWHSVPLRLTDGRIILLPHAIAKELNIALVTCQKRNWLYLEVEQPGASKLSFEIIKSPAFGISVSDPNKTGFAGITTEFVEALCLDFGFVCFKSDNAQAIENIKHICQQADNLIYSGTGDAQEPAARTMAASHLPKPSANTIKSICQQSDLLVVNRNKVTSGDAEIQTLFDNLNSRESERA